MVWAADNTPRKSRFLVVPTAPSAAQEPIGEQDWVSEWFPALTGRRSVATVQGREWLPDFAETVSSDDKLSVCAQRDAACLDSWASKSGRSFDYVYLPKAASADGAQCCWALRQSLASDPSYAPVYDGPGAAIYGYRYLDRAWIVENRSQTAATTVAQDRK